MAKRKRIGLSYTYNENWIGGTYYIENLINALNALNDEEKPHIVLLTDSYESFWTAQQKFKYPYISFQLDSGEANKGFQLLNRITNRLFKIRLFSQKIKALDAVFPYYKSEQQSAAKKKIYWVADFQEHFAPEFFSEDDIASRLQSQQEIQASAGHLIVSSNTALGHFKSIFPQHTVKVSVLPFAVAHPPYQDINIKLLLEKYQLPARYFICPNQFWKHKNQLVVLKAVKELKAEGIEITVAFTGNTNDYRNPHYFTEMKAFVEDNNIGNNVKFLGFIDRRDQLQLMNNAIAIIQPSLFEGWSTVVEDAKLMNKFLLVSDIEIHREQLVNSSARFFDPYSVNQLAQLLQQFSEHQNPPPLFENNTYHECVEKFGRTFLRIID
ncbi:glycosyltransferase family 4 protein [Mucilaginibacter rubeus]|uniref:Glycosyltransferase n=1 Tax=Mucilaginibacter rubeus TaxID=2027860 RepID=A0AAE6MK32_9SPHI|nr:MULTISPECIES: glycosyltransferase [Mucilaginibacter]QEM05797.1 glycosyltransferase family 4 protein [Mucilaginibacter rubeus]QEM18380.1 glycosyltransferase family 4 protein [Mucilaginibacter gossypii]QTE45084.1 glycosyltransferase [Mucilaginibacter rubeus]QTE51681.1 glycosyltransferase [Mucilaginibacter rubeus]QTE56767.1 glycosyltransferase [Mucilaginibacter rubeus]